LSFCCASQEVKNNIAIVASAVIFFMFLNF